MKIKALLLSLLLLGGLWALPTQANLQDVYVCNTKEEAEAAKKYLDIYHHFLYFCSNCDYVSAAIFNVYVDKSSIEYVENCGYKVKVEGKIAQSIKPPVFAGYCAPQLEVGARFRHKTKRIPFQKAIDLASVYVPTSSGNFMTLAHLLQMDEESICIRSMRFTNPKAFKAKKVKKVYRRLR